MIWLQAGQIQMPKSFGADDHFTLVSDNWPIAPIKIQQAFGAEDQYRLVSGKILNITVFVRHNEN